MLKLVFYYIFWFKGNVSGENKGGKGIFYWKVVGFFVLEFVVEDWSIGWF